MYNVTNAYLSAVRARTRTEQITGTITFADNTIAQITEKHIGSRGCSLERSNTKSTDFACGGVTAAKLTIHLKTKRARFVFAQCKIALTYGIKLQDGTWFEIPLGIFRAMETKRIGNGVEIVGYDNTTKLNKKYYGQILVGTPFEVLAKICTLCDLPLGVADLNGFPNSAQNIRIDSTSDCKTYWDCVKQVCMVVAGFGCVNPAGELVVKRFSQTSNTTLEDRNRYSLTASDYICQFTKLIVENTNGGIYVAEKAGGTSNGVDTAILGKGVLGRMVLGRKESQLLPSAAVTSILQFAACWNVGEAEALQSRTEAVLNELYSLPYTPAKWLMPGDPAMEPGDRITHKTDSGTFDSLVTYTLWKFNGKMHVESADSNPDRLALYESRTELPLKDYNGDGKIDLDDVTALRNLIQDGGGTLEDDWNGDGVLNILDVTTFLGLVSNYLGSVPNTSNATAGEVVIADSVEDGRITGTTTIAIPTAYRGKCINVDAARLSGSYIIDENTANSPVSSGMLINSGDGGNDGNVVQIVVSEDGTTRKLRTIWNDIINQWNDL